MKKKLAYIIAIVLLLPGIPIELMLLALAQFARLLDCWYEYVANPYRRWVERITGTGDY